MTSYDDIIHLPHHVSEKRVCMPLADRAAQFSPFAALTGYEDVIAETGRLTERCVELDENAIAELNRQLNAIQSRIFTQPLVAVTYFQPDKYKDGGSYETKTGHVKKLDTTTQHIVFTDRTEISFNRIVAVHLLEAQIPSPDPSV